MPDISQLSRMATDILWMWDLDAGTIIDHGLYLQLLAITWS